VLEKGRAASAAAVEQRGATLQFLSVGFEIGLLGGRQCRRLVERRRRRLLGFATIPRMKPGRAARIGIFALAVVGLAARAADAPA